MSARRVLAAGAAYFALAFGAGMAMGILRVALLVARLGEFLAELLEAPAMLVAIYFAARWAVRRFEIPSAAWPRLGMGFTGLALLLATEFTVVLWLRGLSVERYISERDPAAASLYAAMLTAYGVVVPLVVRR